LDAPTEAHQGVRMIKFSSILSRYEAAEFSQAEAAELLGIGERSSGLAAAFLRMRAKPGLLDRRLGKASGKGFLRTERWRWRRVFAVTAGFTASIFMSILVKEHNLWGYTWKDLPL